MIEIRDDLTVVRGLFDLVNMVVVDMISQPDSVQKLFDSLPDSKKEQVSKRDGETQASCNAPFEQDPSNIV